MQRDRKQVLSEYLVVAAQAGDRAALDRLARLWQADFLRHACRVLGEVEGGHDVLQDAWLDIVRGLPGLKDCAAFPAWAYRIVTRRCARLIRHRQKHRHTARAMNADPPAPVDGAAIAEHRADMAPVQRAIAALPQDQRVAIALYHAGELSIAEIAVALDVPPGTVKTRLMHARRKIRAALEPKGDQDVQQ